MESFGQPQPGCKVTWHPSSAEWHSILRLRRDQMPLDSLTHVMVGSRRSGSEPSPRNCGCGGAIETRDGSRCPGAPRHTPRARWGKREFTETNGLEESPRSAQGVYVPESGFLCLPGEIPGEEVASYTKEEEKKGSRPPCTNRNLLFLLLFLFLLPCFVSFSFSPTHFDIPLHKNSPPRLHPAHVNKNPSPRENIVNKH